jgi:hypothetical protein
MTKLTRMKVVVSIREFHLAQEVKLTHMEIVVSIRELHHAQEVCIPYGRRMSATHQAKVAVSIHEFHREQEVCRLPHGRDIMTMAAHRAKWSMFPRPHHLIYLIHLVMCTSTQRMVPSSMMLFTNGTSDWMMQSASLPGSFTMLMTLKIVAKKSSDKTRMRESNFSSKTRIVERPRQGSAAMRYSPSWKSGRKAYPLYQFLLLDLGTMFLSSNRSMRLPRRRVPVMPLTFWRRFNLSVSNLILKERLFLQRESVNARNLMPSVLGWMKSVPKGFVSWRKSLRAFAETLIMKGSSDRLRTRNVWQPMNVMRACVHN